MWRWVRSLSTSFWTAPGATTVAARGHVEVSARGQLVEVVAGHVGVEIEADRGFGRRHALGRGAGEEVDLTACGGAEGRGDGRDRV